MLSIPGIFMDTIMLWAAGDAFHGDEIATRRIVVDVVSAAFRKKGNRVLG
jgi:hypothetical protein